MKLNYYPNRNLEPLTMATATAIAAGAQLAGQGVNAMSHASMNKKTRLWNEKMYAQQRADALADWTMQNQYNSPEEQMKRLKMSGLNPNLVYGKGADNISGTVRSAESKSWNPTPPTLNFGSVVQSGLNAYFDTQLRQAQVDNLKTQNTVLVNEAALKAAQTAATAQGTESSKFDLGLKSDLRDISLQAAEQSLRKTIVETDIALQSNERAILQNNMNLKTGEINLQKTAQEILSSRINNSKSQQEIQNLKQTKKNLENSNQLQQIEIDLRKQGINPNDKMWERILGEFINSAKDKLFPKQQDGKLKIPKYFW